VLVGATWTYALTGGPIHDTAVRSISAVTGDGFTDTVAHLSGSSSTGEWRCRGGELTSVSVGAAVSFVASQRDMVYQIVDQNGVSLPATVRDGDTWAREIAFAGSGLITGKPVEATGNALIACSAGPTEQVVVPAGAFDAVPVVCTTDTILNLRSGDVDFPMSRSSSSTSWYALDLGLIKWDGETSEVGQFTFELVSFSFP
jgi:hypothetical protein